MTNSRLVDVAYFPAEAKLFGSADIATSTLVWRLGERQGVEPNLTRYDKDLRKLDAQKTAIHPRFLRETDYVLPVSLGAEAIGLMQRLSAEFPAWKELEGRGSTSLWAGREIDETGHTTWLSSQGTGPLFIKGRMIDRFRIREAPRLRVAKDGWAPPASVRFERIAWRDISRPNQKRRVIASLIEPGWTAGNSLGVAHFRDGNRAALRGLLGVMSSLVFEFQLRGHLATGHVSLSSLRKVRPPGPSGLDAL